MINFSPSIIRKSVRVTILVIGLAFCSEFSIAKQVNFPITLDYGLLKAFLIQSSYTDTNNTAQLINEGNGCIALTLSDPEITGADNVVHLSSEVYLHVGTPLGESCLMPYEWNGSIQMSQIPKLNNETWELSFETVDTKIYSSDGTPVKSFNLVWDRMMPVINSYLQDFSVKLAPPVEDLKTCIIPLFTPEAQTEAEMLLNSIRPGGMSIDNEGVIVSIIAEATEIEESQQVDSTEQLSESELASFLELWETWDSLLVYLVSMLSEQPLAAADKQILMDLLLDTRHQFVSQINDQSIERDFVRDQFLEGWHQLSQIFKKHALHGSVETGLGYLSFITAADALMILDELGPTFGVEVSRSGLIRLAKILGGESLELNYSPGINRGLQQLFEVDPAEELEEPAQKQPATSKPPQQDTSLRILFNSLNEYLFPVAFAAPLPSFQEIKKWQVPETDLTNYMDRIQKVLEVAVTTLGIHKDLSNTIIDMYHILIPAVAWQESCFRQFTVKKNKLTYLLSYNNSSVGLMQVNERVWRGIYDTQRLRWDIRYNASAGSEIVDLYLQKYALRKSGPDILADEQTLCQLVYAMYNGGPSQYAKFLKRKADGALYDSDNLFTQKYSWVKSQSWNNIERCL